MIRGLFITGTDTNVGKTVASAAIFHRYRDLAPLRYWKPIQTGIEDEDTASDTAEVRRLAALSEAEVLDEGARYRDPISPQLAAERAGDVISLHRLRMLLPANDATRWIVEGAGGVLVPLNRANTLPDFINLLGLRVLIVARSALGTINHTLLTLEALRSRALSVAGVVMVGEPDDDNRQAIEHYGNVPVLGQMPKFDPLTPEALGKWAREHLDPTGILKEYLV
jgi:dethiobiotin synthetase